MPDLWTAVPSLVSLSWMADSLPDAPELEGPCDKDATICQFVRDATGNDVLANATDLLIGRPLTVVAIIVVGLLVRWVLHRFINRMVRRAEEGPTTRKGRVKAGLGGTAVTRRTDATRRKQRARSMGSLLKSVITVIVLVVVAIMALAEIGVNITPLIASAGIIGIAIGFGAQALVQDFLSGTFMMIEDQYGVGDWIDVGDANGEVEAVSLRVTRLRDMNGTVWYVRNGEILRVGNMSQNWARTVLDVPVSYHDDLDQVIDVLRQVAHELWHDDEYGPQVLEEPEVWGAQEFSENYVLVRVALKTGPAEQWGVAREMRRRIKSTFYQAGIDIPVPQRVVWQRSPEEPAPGEGVDDRSRAGRNAATTTDGGDQ